MLETTAECLAKSFDPALCDGWGQTYIHTVQVSLGVLAVFIIIDLFYSFCHAYGKFSGSLILLGGGLACQAAIAWFTIYNPNVYIIL
jgi:hypothetical protein